MELKKVQEQFNKVLSYSQDVPLHAFHTDKIFQQWKAQKARFMNAMNGMSYELDTPVTFDLDDKSRDEKVNQFIDWVYREYGEDMYQFFVDNHDAILENKLQHPWGDFPAGMKLSKVLMRQFGMDAEAVRQKLSMLIQSNKVTGKLVLSVHPLDFLSASENNHG